MSRDSFWNQINVRNVLIRGDQDSASPCEAIYRRVRPETSHGDVYIPALSVPLHRQCVSITFFLFGLSYAPNSLCDLIQVLWRQI